MENYQDEGGRIAIPAGAAPLHARPDAHRRPRTDEDPSSPTTTASTPRAWRRWSGSRARCPTTSGSCAPETEQSGASRALTLSEPLRVRRLDERRFAVVGTPTDCVMLAIQDLIEGGKPDLVLSGVNRGHNAAEDVTMSGTVAGAIEGMALGVPAIALSQTMAATSTTT